MLKFVKKFALFFEFFKSNIGKRRHNVHTKYFKENFHLPEHFINEFINFGEYYFSHSVEGINFDYFYTFSDWFELKKDFMVKCEEFFLFQNTGLYSFLENTPQFSDSELNNWIKAMNLNSVSVKKVMNTLIAMEIITHHKKRYHYFKDFCNRESYSHSQCFYVLPNFEIIFLKPDFYLLFIQLMKYFKFVKMNYEAVFRIDNDYLKRTITSETQLKELEELFKYSISDIPENLKYFIESIKKELHGTEYKGTGILIKVKNKSEILKFKKFIENYSDCLCVENIIFIPSALFENFQKYCKEEKISIKNQDEFTNKLKKIVEERFNREEIAFLWELFYYLSFFLSKFKIIDRWDKNKFDKLFHLITLINKNENNKTENDIATLKRGLRKKCEEVFQRYLFSFSRKLLIENMKLQFNFSNNMELITDSMRWNKLIHIEVKKENGKIDDYFGKVVGYNQLGFILQKGNQKKSRFILWEELLSVKVL